MSIQSPLYRIEGDANVEINGLKMSQNIIAVGAWMNTILTVEPSLIVEIGTCRGGFSKVLSECAAYVGAHFKTYDIRNSISYPLHPNGKFYNVDVFGSAFEEIKATIKNSTQVIVLCDGGDKMREFETFIEFLKPGDIIGVHDSPDLDLKQLDWAWEEAPRGLIEVIAYRNGFSKFSETAFRLSGWAVFSNNN